jgi:hypothetical protein
MNQSTIHQVPLTAPWQVSHLVLRLATEVAGFEAGFSSRKLKRVLWISSSKKSNHISLAAEHGKKGIPPTYPWSSYRSFSKRGHMACGGLLVSLCRTPASVVTDMRRRPRLPPFQLSSPSKELVSCFSCRDTACVKGV